MHTVSCHGGPVCWLHALLHALTLPSPPPVVYTSSVGPETAVTVAVLSIWPAIIEATKSLNKSGKESVPLFPWNEPWNQA